MAEVGEDVVVIADIPGLIAGAHRGSGLGDRFLGHVERCSVLLHLVDGTGADVGAAYRTVRSELAAYGGGLADKPEVAALNKCDALSEAAIAQGTQALAAAGAAPVHRLSGVSGLGCAALLGALRDRVAAARQAGRDTAPRAFVPGGAA